MTRDIARRRCPKNESHGGLISRAVALVVMVMAMQIQLQLFPLSFGLELGFEGT
jgi:hypothetical protein